jgi:uncharacterized protein DUF3291
VEGSDSAIGHQRVYRLAQVNVARPRAPLDAPMMGEFVAALDPINRLAERSTGFLWRLPSSQSHGATRLVDDPCSVVMSVSLWESYEALHAFLYRSPHGAYVRRRFRWFRQARQPSTALWWVAVEERPTVDEAMRRLRFLQANGASPYAFTLLQRFEPDGRPARLLGRGPTAKRSPTSR